MAALLGLLVMSSFDYLNVVVELFIWLSLLMRSGSWPDGGEAAVRNRVSMRPMPVGVVIRRPKWGCPALTDRADGSVRLPAW